MVGNGHAAHAVANGLVYEFRHCSLAVKHRVLGVNVKMNEVLHTDRRGNRGATT